VTTCCHLLDLREFNSDAGCICSLYLKKHIFSCQKNPTRNSHVTSREYMCICIVLRKSDIFCGRPKRQVNFYGKTVWSNFPSLDFSPLRPINGVSQHHVFLTVLSVQSQQPDMHFIFKQTFQPWGYRSIPHNLGRNPLPRALSLNIIRVISSDIIPQCSWWQLLATPKISWYVGTSSAECCIRVSSPQGWIKGLYRTLGELNKEYSLLSSSNNPARQNKIHVSPTSPCGCQAQVFV
jgi:hypothetical protein